MPYLYKTETGNNLFHRTNYTYSMVNQMSNNIYEADNKSNTGDSMLSILLGVSYGLSPNKSCASAT
jgi:hypothetical protein